MHCAIWQTGRLRLNLKGALRVRALWSKPRIAGCRLQGGVQGRFGFAGWSLNATISALSEQLKGDKAVDGGSFIARHKTKERAALFDAVLAMHVDFSALTKRGRQFLTSSGGKVLALPGIEITVAIPERETVGAAGEMPEFSERLFPPRRLQEGRLALSDIVTDVRPVDPDSVDAVEDLLKGLDVVGKRFYGEPAWRTIRGKLTEELSLQVLHQSLKGMTSGQPLTVEAFDSKGEVTAMIDITARVESALQSGETEQSEFNIGTVVLRSQTNDSLTSKAIQAPAPLQFSVPSLSGTPIAASGAASVQIGRDLAQVSRTVFEIGATTKTKSPGVLFDGVVDLQFTLRKPTPEAGDINFSTRAHVDPPYRRSSGKLGFTVLVERSDARVEAGGGRADGVATEPSDANDVGLMEHPIRWELGMEVPGPPGSVWNQQAGGGFNDRVVIRDLPDMATLRDRVDRLGRRVLGGKYWNEKRTGALATFDQANLAGRFSWMTRGYELRTPDMRGVTLTATARVLSMEFSRYQKKAEFATVNESTTSMSNQRMWSDSATTQASGGFTSSLGDPGESMSPSGVRGDQVRHREGTQYGFSNKLVSNGKGATQRVIFTATAEVTLKATGTEPDRIEVPIEISMDAEDTWLYTVGSDGRPVFTSESIGRPRTHSTPGSPIIGLPERFVKRGAMSASDVLRGLGPEAIQVLKGIEREMEKRFGRLPHRIRQQLESRFDPFALGAELSNLTRGSAIHAQVDLGGRRMTVSVAAQLQPNLRHTRTIPKFEFEFGSQQRASTGTTQDFWHRKTASVLSRFKVPYVDLTAGQQRIWDRSRGASLSSTAREVSSVKTVEDANLLAGDVSFNISIRREGSIKGSEIALPSVRVPVEIAVPQRDSEPIAATPLPRRDWPIRIKDSRRLGDTDVVTDTYLLAVDGHPDAEARDAIQPLEAHGLRVLGGDWHGMREKIRAMLLDRDLPAKLKPMMAGSETVLRHGRSTVRVSAHVEELRYANQTGATEFNSGVGMQQVLASTDGSTMEGRGVGHTTTVGALVTMPTGVGAAPMVGGNATVSWGSDRQDREARAASSGVSVKAKHPATSYASIARLIVRMEREPLMALGDQTRAVPDVAQTFAGTDRDPSTTEVSRFITRSRGIWRSVRRVGTPSRTMATTRIGFSALIETVSPPLDDLIDPIEARVPPQRVWEPLQGLRDTDVVRWLGDSSGVNDILREFGPGALGKRRWKHISDLAQRTLDQPRLAAHLNMRPGAEDLATPNARRRILNSQSGVHANLRLVRLQYMGSDSKAEVSPSNETFTVRTRTQLHWNSTAGQAQLGASLDGTDIDILAIAGREVRNRQGISAADGGL
ncbi:hypothetical protein ACFQ51_54670 [Streptomyces kaempferi]